MFFLTLAVPERVGSRVGIKKLAWIFQKSDSRVGIKNMGKPTFRLEGRYKKTLRIGGG